MCHCCIIIVHMSLIWKRCAVCVLSLAYTLYTAKLRNCVRCLHHTYIHVYHVVLQEGTFYEAGKRLELKPLFQEPPLHKSRPTTAHVLRAVDMSSFQKDFKSVYEEHIYHIRIVILITDLHIEITFFSQGECSAMWLHFA
mgnify:FL=1